MHAAAATTTAAANPATVDGLPSWPRNARVGDVVRRSDGRELRVVVTTDGNLAVEGVGAYAIVETVRVAERRPGARALAARLI
jgi:hypothetical protein